MEPVYQGEPILAVAAVDEFTAAEAIEKIVIEFEPLPFVVDPWSTPAAGQPQRPTAGQHLDAAGGTAGGAPGRAGAARRGCRRRRRRCCGNGSGCRSGTCRGCGRCCPRLAAEGAPTPGAGRNPQNAAANATAGASAAGPAAAAAGQAPVAGQPPARGAAPAGRGGGPAAPPQPQIAELKWTEEDFAAAETMARCRWARPPTSGRSAMSTRFQERRSRARRNLRHAVHRPPAARNANGDGLLAERQAVHARLDAEHGADGCGASRAGVGIPPRPRRRADQRVHRRRLRQQDSRAPSRWRFRRCSRRKPTRR